jgi:fibronectin type 3 domain-containing protein
MKRLLLLFTLLTASALAAQSVPCGAPAVPLATNVALTTYTDAAIVNGATYFYAVNAVDANGNASTCTSVVTASIPATGTHTVTLTWTASTTPGVTYAVFRAQAPNPPTNLTKTVN